MIPDYPPALLASNIGPVTETSSPTTTPEAYAIERAAPVYGEHIDYVLGRVLEMTVDDVEVLLQAGAVRRAPPAKS